MNSTTDRRLSAHGYDTYHRVDSADEGKARDNCRSAETSVCDDPGRGWPMRKRSLNNTARLFIVVAATVLGSGLVLSSSNVHSVASSSTLQSTTAESLECHPGFGGQLFAAGGPVEIEILQAYSDSTSDIFLFKAGQAPLPIGSDDQTKRVVHLGALPAGSEILFGIKVRETGNTFRMGAASRNSDGVVHARVECITGAIAKVYFEDKIGGGDNDFNDVIIQVRISRKRGITGLIDQFTDCPPTGIKSTVWGEFGRRNSLESNSGEKLQLRCENIGHLPSYKLFYSKPTGETFRVGVCPFEAGRNTGYFTYSGDVDRDDKPDSFVLTRWESKDYGLNDIPNFWTGEQQENPALLDHAVSIYDVFRDNLSKYSDKYEYRTPPPTPSEGPFVRRVTGLDPPLGPITEAFFDHVEQGLQQVPVSGLPMTLHPYSPADLNEDGTVDASDMQIFSGSVGRCDPDPDFLSSTDFDGDGCTTSLDEDIFHDLLSGATGNRRPRAEGKNIVLTADSSCTASITPSDVDDGSFDPDGNTIHLSIDPTGPFPLGEHLVTLTVTDSHGAASSFITTVTVVSRPVIQGISTSKTELWPANHKMADVTVDYLASDNCAVGPIVCLLSVSSNEPVNGTGDGDTSPDWEVVDAHRARLRAERAGTGNGRRYTINITCTNTSGNLSHKNVLVTVPKSIGADKK